MISQHFFNLSTVKLSKGTKMVFFLFSVRLYVFDLFIFIVQASASPIFWTPAISRIRLMAMGRRLGEVAMAGDESAPTNRKFRKRKWGRRRNSRSSSRCTSAEAAGHITTNSSRRWRRRERDNDQCKNKIGMIEIAYDVL